ncbi:hypothetical protein GAMM_40010 [Gammaproteobacteria bacterium]
MFTTKINYIFSYVSLWHLSPPFIFVKDVLNALLFNQKRI